MAAVFGMRVEQFARMHGRDKDEIAAMFGVDKATLTHWLAGNGPGFRKAVLFADYFLLSLDWLSGRRDHPIQSPALIQAQEQLREWAKTELWVSELSKGERLLQTINRLRDLVSIADKVLCLYTRWEKSDWDLLLSGSLEPKDHQIEGAALVTGLPFMYLADGNVRCLGNDDAARYNLLVAEAAALRLTPEQAVRRLRNA